VRCSEQATQETRAETFDRSSRNHPETIRWQTVTIELGRGGSGASVTNGSGSWRLAMPFFLKPLIGFTSSTTLLTSLMLLAHHVA
jgi:hypothetical protein